MNEKGECTATDPYHYEVPDASIEILTPRGFTVSIPDQKGIKLFAFHGKINEPFDGREAGYFARDITKAREGRWTFTDRSTLLNPEDIIYYWLYVDYEDPSGRKLGYLKEDQEYTVGGESSCMKSLTTWNGGVACSAQLLFDEQFHRLDTANWTKDIRYADDPDFEFVIYDKYENNLNVKEGQLHIRPTLVDERYGTDFIYSKEEYDVGSSCTADIPNDCKRASIGGYTLPPIFSGRIVSKNFFKYGRVEVRAKLPKGDWIYPQILLSPKQYEYGKNSYDSGEIRIAFVGGNAHLTNELQGRIMLGTSTSARNYGITKTTSNDWCDDYHLFSVIWNPVINATNNGNNFNRIDHKGVKRVIFHCKVNEEFDGLEDGYFVDTITNPENGRWTFREFSHRFQVGDTIHYWLQVNYFDGTKTTKYRKENQIYVVNNIPKNNANKGQGNKGQGNKGQGNKGNHGNHGNNGNHGNQGHGNQPDEEIEEPVYTIKPTTLPTPATPACNFSPTLVNGRSTCSGRLIFEENFADVITSRWQTEVKFADEPDYEFVIYGLGGTTYNQNGQLHVKPIFAEENFGLGFVNNPEGLDLGVNCTSTEPHECVQKPVAYFILPPVLSGRINTKPSFSFLYGRVDIRAKLPEGDWIYPELFLTPKKFEYGSLEYSSGEIRIAFVPGNANLDKELQAGIMLGSSDEAREFGLRKVKNEISWNKDFHIFSVIWKPDSIQFLADGKPYANIYPPPGGFANIGAKYNPDAATKWKTGDVIAPFDKEMVITVGVGVGGHSFLDSTPGKPYTNVEPKAQIKFYKAKDTWLPTWSQNSELIVDYIKVYAI
ncbi:glycosyl hydrolase-related [Holotrichia oblita]|uniref:Glycosyl hydrolase-related n=1 Tax=Holotrichia oblita TaxID=644536 RepID=A0ACB9TTS0_HOLOL|nr:glycosyl hydrolase-related [Holotrichia oblita]